ncbi:hypothetical protein ACVDFE_09025 [Lentzea chajnantorensis]
MAVRCVGGSRGADVAAWCTPSAGGVRGAVGGGAEVVGAGWKGAEAFGAWLPWEAGPDGTGPVVAWVPGAGADGAGPVWPWGADVLLPAGTGWWLLPDG